VAVAGRPGGGGRGVEVVGGRVDRGAAPVPPPFADRPSASADMRAMWQEYDRHGLRGNSNVLRMLLGREPASFEQAAAVFAARG